MNKLLVLGSLTALNLFPCSQVFSFQANSTDERFAEVARLYVSANANDKVTEVKRVAGLTGPSDSFSCLTRVFHQGVYDVFDSNNECSTRVEVNEYKSFTKGATHYETMGNYNPEIGRMESEKKKLELYMDTRVISTTCK